jgi:hypothetical protein
VERRVAFDLDPIESKIRQERFSVRTFPFLQQADLAKFPLVCGTREHSFRGRMDDRGEYEATILNRIF